MTSRPSSTSAQAHPWHAFEGMYIVEASDGTCLVAARCSCGDVIDVADAVFAPCPSHEGPDCARCGGSSEIVDHRALAWRAATDAELQRL